MGVLMGLNGGPGGVIGVLVGPNGVLMGIIGVLMGVMGDLGLLWGHGPPWGSPAAAVSLGGGLEGVIGVLMGVIGVLMGVVGVPMAAIGTWTAMGQPSRCHESGGGA